MGDVFDQAAQADQPTDVFDAAAKTPSGGIGQTNQSFGQNLSTALAGEDTHVPLTSYGKATEQGVLNVVQGTSQAVQGLGHMIAHPVDTLANIGDVATLGLTHLLPGSDKAAGGDTVSGLAQVKQVPGAIKDINQSADPVGAYADVAEKTASQGAGQALVAAATDRLAVGGAKAVKAVKSLVGVPAALSADTSSTLATIAHNEGLPPLASTTAREAATEIQKSFISKAKEFYSPVDKAVGGDLKPVQEKIAQLRAAVKEQSHVNPDLADKYMDQLTVQQKTLGELVQKAKVNGVPNAEELMDKGDAYYVKGMAMKQVEGGVKTASGLAKQGGHPNPSLFANQMDKLYNNGTLTRALGEDGAKAMLDTAKAGYEKGKTVGAIKAAAKKTIPYAAGGAALGVAGAGAAKVLSGQ